MSEPTMIKVRANATPDEVYRALTEPERLRAWLTEHAEVALPERYEFWGPSTPAGDKPRQRLTHAGPRQLRFEWPIDDSHTEVQIDIADRSVSGESIGTEGAPGFTEVTVNHDGLPGYDAMVAERETISQVHTFWALSLANLVDHLEGRPTTPRCDFTSPVQRAEVTIDAAPEDVFRSLLDAETFSRWFGARVEVEPELGGRWAMGSFEVDTDPARITALEPGRALTLAWAEGLVASWELEGSGGKTKLTLVQSGFDEGQPPYGAWMGWLSGIAELRRFHELPAWRPLFAGTHVDGMPEDLLTY